MTSPPCRCNWGKIHGETDNPAKIWNKSPANRQDIASANLGHQLGHNTCSISRIPRLRQKCNLDFHSGEVTRPLSAFLSAVSVEVRPSSSGLTTTTHTLSPPHLANREHAAFPPTDRGVTDRVRSASESSVQSPATNSQTRPARELTGRARL